MTNAGLISRSLNNVQKIHVINWYVSEDSKPGISHGFHLRQEVDVNKGPHLPLKKEKPSDSSRFPFSSMLANARLSANTTIR